MSLSEHPTVQRARFLSLRGDIIPSMYSCGSCGYQSGKWMGFCPRCKSSEGLEAISKTASKVVVPRAVPLPEIRELKTQRVPVGMAEFDRVLGGGLVPGGVVLVGGEPGVGKSTLLTQVSGTLSALGHTVLIATAEESAEQVGLRSQRLGIESDRVLLIAEDDVDAIIASAQEVKPALLIVDSIQTVGVSEVGGAPGSVAQVRECSARLIRFAKDQGISTVLVGHVTKDGGIAGPKLLEHMVDVVLYLEGETDRGFRTLHGLKNRFGATHLVGLFEMAEEGLAEVPDPSAVFLADWQGSVPGTVIFPAMQGKRCVLVEIQALVSASGLPQPRRSVRGIETARVHQILAVLDRHADLRFSERDVYVSVVGGIKLTEPAADLAVGLALASSLVNQPLGALAAWGEVGLTGELRTVPHEQRRREEARRLGVQSVVSPTEGGPSRLRAALGQSGLVLDDRSARQ